MIVLCNTVACRWDIKSKALTTRKKLGDIRRMVRIIVGLGKYILLLKCLAHTRTRPQDVFAFTRCKLVTQTKKNHCDSLSIVLILKMQTQKLYRVELLRHLLAELTCRCHRYSRFDDASRPCALYNITILYEIYLFFSSHILKPYFETRRISLHFTGLVAQDESIGNGQRRVPVSYKHVIVHV
jgi:hypothetical protein